MSVLVIMPTILGRPTKDVIDTFLQQGASMRVYLNGFESVPDDWPVQGWVGSQEMDYRLSPQRRGPAVRYSEPVDGYDYVCFVDDDLIYPEDYVETSIDQLGKLGPKTAVTWHASYWTEGTESFKRRFGIQAVAASVKYWRVPYTGSGALIMRAKDFNALAGDVPSPFEFEDDMWISSRLAKGGIDLIRPPSQRRWIDIPQSMLQQKDTLWNRAMEDGFRKRDEAFRMARKDCPMWDIHDWHGFYDPKERR